MQLSLLTILCLMSMPVLGQKGFIGNGTSEKENEIIKNIWSLLEVRDRANYIDNQTSGKRNLKVWIYKTPKNLKKKYYWIKVGEDNGGVYVSHFNFFVYPDNLEVKYFDTATEQEIELSSWRKKNKNVSQQ